MGAASGVRTGASVRLTRHWLVLCRWRLSCSIWPAAPSLRCWEGSGEGASSGPAALLLGGVTVRCILRRAVARSCGGVQGRGAAIIIIALASVAQQAAAGGNRCRCPLLRPSLPSARPSGIQRLCKLVFAH